MGSHGASCSGRSPHTATISSLVIIGLSDQPGRAWCAEGIVHMVRWTEVRESGGAPWWAVWARNGAGYRGRAPLMMTGVDVARYLRRNSPKEMLCSRAIGRSAAVGLRIERCCCCCCATMTSLLLCHCCDDARDAIIAEKVVIVAAPTELSSSILRWLGGLGGAAGVAARRSCVRPIERAALESASCTSLRL